MASSLGRRLQRRPGRRTWITSIYLQGIDSTEISDAAHARHAPMVPVDATLRLEAARGTLPVVVRCDSARRGVLHCVEGPYRVASR